MAIKKIHLKEEEYNFLLEILNNHDDCGSSLGGYKSTNLNMLIKKIEAMGK